MCIHATQFDILATVYEEGEITDDKRGTDTTHFVCLRGPTFFLSHYENYVHKIMIVLIGL